jgi:cob(I)alamin adenosyltransferase
MLILDEVLGLIDNKIITNDELKSIIAAKPEHVTLILTGIQLSMDTCVIADEVSKIETVKFKIFE